jgi:hypothetical protein
MKGKQYVLVSQEARIMVLGSRRIFRSLVFLSPSSWHSWRSSDSVRYLEVSLVSKNCPLFKSLAFLMSGREQTSALMKRKKMAIQKLACG